MLIHFFIYFYLFFINFIFFVESIMFSVTFSGNTYVGKATIPPKII